MPRGTSENSLDVGDLLLAVNGVPVASATAVEQVLWQPNKTVTLTVHRCGKIFERTVAVSQVRSDGASRVVHWAGCVLRETPRVVLEAFGLPEELEYPGVFCSKVLPGSPAAEGGLEDEFFVRSIGSKPLRTLDDLVAAVKARSLKNLLPDEGFIRVDIVDMDGWDEVRHVRESSVFWPTVELQSKSGGNVERIQH
jgi:S1-C subfamily serine protease